jgi:hypothetical protein
VLRIVPYAALHFGAYEHYREALVGFAARASATPVAEYHVSPLLDLVAGSAAGATAVMAGLPFLFHPTTTTSSHALRRSLEASLKTCSPIKWSMLVGFAARVSATPVAEYHVSPLL